MCVYVGVYVYVCVFMSVCICRCVYVGMYICILPWKQLCTGRLRVSKRFTKTQSLERLSSVAGPRVPSVAMMTKGHQSDPLTPH